MNEVRELKSDLSEQCLCWLGTDTS